MYRSAVIFEKICRRRLDESSKDMGSGSARPVFLVSIESTMKPEYESEGEMDVDGGHEVPGDDKRGVTVAAKREPLSKSCLLLLHGKKS